RAPSLPTGGGNHAGHGADHRAGQARSCFGGETRCGRRPRFEEGLRHMDYKDAIRTIPDYPKPGIQFRDITTLLGNPRAFRRAVDEMVQPYAGVRVDKVAGLEARGFILGGAVAHQLSTGFVPVRKKGKLPFTVLGEDYALEYGQDRVEIHTDAIKPGENVLLVDDLIATGGTALAGIR